ncbi:BOI-related E3 ubiquitin-protein ligase 1 [Punica granatum]|uniref:RING-type domain-containing protein n=2 Tax=Punica granatum TaxID=22663 RepID=A0A218XTM4_PUNGR|nr:BOI-related E3 ubiquitin-protein ligase 1 [Punica granatum]OWM88313.1 hypothetical protein CDL15_Pgr003725 [Punica granatum]PKI46927.1 hypothetical protein CRG98_032738 [Punica granatum]
MAVQAQYPSNVLFLNRNVQEGQDYSLQPHPAGIFLDQSHVLHNNGGMTNQRKRGREAADNNMVGPSSSMNVYSLSQQPQQPPQLIDLSQLHNNSVSTGLRLSFNNQHHHHYHQQQQQQQQQKIVDNSSEILSMFKEDLTAHVRQQREEIDQFLLAQGEQLRRTLAEKRQRHYHGLLGAAEESLARRLREKEAEVEKARRRNAELQARAAQLGAEAQVWQEKARSQEAAAVSLRAHLQQAMMGGGAHDRKVDSCGVAVSEGQAAEDAESVYVDPDRTALSEPSCKACRRRTATVLLLPCRHLSLCKECERVAHTCPLCYCARSSSIEVHLP